MIDRLITLRNGLKNGRLRVKNAKSTVIIYLIKKTCSLALKYMGCFADGGSKGKDLNGTVDDNINSGGTIESCIDKCKQSKYAYAGMQSG